MATEVILRQYVEHLGNRGEVVKGPADQKLKSYAVSSDAENIYIHLS